jgi:hypothetical protein
MAFTVRHGPKLYYAGQLKAGKKTQSLMVWRTRGNNLRGILRKPKRRSPHSVWSLTHMGVASHKQPSSDSTEQRRGCHSQQEDNCCSLNSAKIPLLSPFTDEGCGLLERTGPEEVCSPWCRHQQVLCLVMARFLIGGTFSLWPHMVEGTVLWGLFRESTNLIQRTPTLMT